MNLLKLMKYGPAIAELIAAIEGAQSGQIDVPVKGIRVAGSIWDLDVKGTRRPAKAGK